MRRSICPPLCVSIALFAACSDDLPGSDFDEAGGESGVMASGTSSEASAGTTALESTSEGGPMSGPMPGPHDDEGGDACGYVGEIVDDGMICFFDAEDPTEVVATILGGRVLYEKR